MEVITIESEAYKNLIQKMDYLLDKVSLLNNHPKDPLLSTEEAMALLKLTTKTLYNYRMSGLAYIKRGRKIYYRQSDIERYLAQGYNEGF